MNWKPQDKIKMLRKTGRFENEPKNISKNKNWKSKLACKDKGNYPEGNTKI